jgi:hypothetical protein
MASLILKKERRMDARCLVFAVLALCGLSASGGPLVNRYDALRTAALSTCQAVDAGEYQTGLFFNPDGYRSYYARSLCYQNAAITLPDHTPMATESHGKIRNTGSSFRVFRVIPWLFIGLGP